MKTAHHIYDLVECGRKQDWYALYTVLACAAMFALSILYVCN